MLNKILYYLDFSAELIIFFAVLVIIIGLTFTAVRYVRQLKQVGRRQNFLNFKRDFGSLLTLGLEIIVIADVIKTITKTPTIASLSFLAFLVLLRTIVTWTLTLEVESCWPWKVNKKKRDHV